MRTRSRSVVLPPPSKVDRTEIRVTNFSANWREAAEKARYLLNLFAASLAAQDPRRQKLISAVLDDFE
jgi:hypothetical protein